MTRYVSRKQPRSWFDYGEDFDTRSVQPLGNPVVRSGPVETGILDKDGNEIIRLPEEVGFYEKDRSQT